MSSAGGQIDPGPAPRSGAAAKHIGLDRVTQARTAVPCQRRQQRGLSSSSTSGSHRDDRGDHVAAPALLLRPVGLHSHLAAGASRRDHRRRPWSTRCFATSMGDDGVINWRACLTRSSSSNGPAPDPHQHAHAALVTQAGGWMAPRPHPRGVAALAAWRRRAVRDVRADRGDRPHGVPPARPRRAPPGRDRRADPGWPGSSCGRSTALPTASVSSSTRGPNVMLGYANGDRDLAAGRAPSRSWATGDLGPLRRRTTTCTRSSADGPGSSSRSGCASTSTVRLRCASCRLAAARDRRPARSSPATTSTSSSWHRAPPPQQHVRRSLDAVVDLPPDGVDDRRRRRRPTHRVRGKVDHAAVLALRRRPPVPPAPPAPRSATSTPATDVLRAVLGRAGHHARRARSCRSAVTRSATSNARSDSRRLLGRVPPDWHVMSAGELDRAGRRTRVPRARHHRPPAGRRHLPHRVHTHVRSGTSRAAPTSCSPSSGST